MWFNIGGYETNLKLYDFKYFVNFSRYVDVFSKSFLKLPKKFQIPSILLIFQVSDIGT